MRKVAILSVLISLVACSHDRPRSDQAAPAGETTSEQALSDSVVDITYQLGHNHHRFVAHATPGTAQAQCYLDRTIVREATIDKTQYVEFLSRAMRYASKLSAQSTTHSERAPAANSDLPCRAPFIITVRIGKDTQVANGCRSSDEGGLSRLVRDGEFLLYSKK